MRKMQNVDGNNEDMVPHADVMTNMKIMTEDMDVADPEVTDQVVADMDVQMMRVHRIITAVVVAIPVVTAVMTRMMTKEVMDKADGSVTPKVTLKQRVVAGKAEEDIAAEEDTAAVVAMIAMTIVIIAIMMAKVADGMAILKVTLKQHAVVGKIAEDTKKIKGVVYANIPFYFFNNSSASGSSVLNRIR
jgi:hypothetical protein